MYHNIDQMSPHEEFINTFRANHQLSSIRNNSNSNNRTTNSSLTDESEDILFHHRTQSIDSNKLTKHTYISFNYSQFNKNDNNNNNNESNENCHIKRRERKHRFINDPISDDTVLSSPLKREIQTISTIKPMISKSLKYNKKQIIKCKQTKNYRNNKNYIHSNLRILDNDTTNGMFSYYRNSDTTNDNNDVISNSQTLLNEKNLLKKKNDNIILDSFMALIRINRPTKHQSIVENETNDVLLNQSGIHNINYYNNYYKAWKLIYHKIDTKSSIKQSNIIKSIHKMNIKQSNKFNLSIQLYRKYKKHRNDQKKLKMIQKQLLLNAKTNNSNNNNNNNNNNMNPLLMFNDFLTNSFNFISNPQKNIKENNINNENEIENDDICSLIGYESEDETNYEYINININSNNNSNKLNNQNIQENNKSNNNNTNETQYVGKKITSHYTNTLNSLTEDCFDMNYHRNNHSNHNHNNLNENNSNNHSKSNNIVTKNFQFKQRKSITNNNLWTFSKENNYNNHIYSNEMEVHDNQVEDEEVEVIRHNNKLKIYRICHRK